LFGGFEGIVIFETLEVVLTTLFAVIMGRSISNALGTVVKDLSACSGQTASAAGQISTTSQVLADAVVEGLRREALAVDVAYDGDAALERLGVNEYDVLVLDRDLPGMHGDDICAALVASGALTRVLMLTASGTVAG